MNVADKICANLCLSYRFFYDCPSGYLVFACGYDSSFSSFSLENIVWKAIPGENFVEMTTEQVEEFVLLCSMEHTFS